MNILKNKSHSHQQIIDLSSDKNINTQTRTKDAIYVSIISIIANIILSILKIAIGFFANSYAIIADGIHSISDLATDFIVILGAKLSQKPPDESHHYGHGKIETIMGSLLGIILIIASLGIMYSGVNVLIKYTTNNHSFETPHIFAFWIAILSIIIKELLYQFTNYLGEKHNNISLIANAWHHRSDAFSSVAVAIGIAGAIFLGKKWSILDPLFAVIVGGFVFIIAIKIIISTYNDLMDGSLGAKIEKEIMDLVAENPKIKNPHNLKTRRVGSYVDIDLHIRIDANLSLYKAHQISTQVESAIKQKFQNRAFVSIHIEPFF